MSNYKNIITYTAKEMLVELKKQEQYHPKINAIFIKGDKTNLILSEDFTNRVSPPKYGISLEFC